MLDTAVDAVRKTTGCPVRVLERIRCHHNYAETETRDGQTLWITRKGAIRARKGDVGIIPGSMGDSTYIVEGLGNQQSHQSAAHGAGRAMSRTDAKRLFDTQTLTAAMAGKTWLEDKAEQLVDETPQAYKNIHDVMDAQNGLCRAVNKLEAVVNYKGT